MTISIIMKPDPMKKKYVKKLPKPSGKDGREDLIQREKNAGSKMKPILARSA